jgi:hypothetical protein
LPLEDAGSIEVLPFTHPKLAVTAVVSEQDFATVLDRRLKRIEQMKAKISEAKQHKSRPSQIQCPA